MPTMVLSRRGPTLSKNVRVLANDLFHTICVRKTLPLCGLFTKSRNDYLALGVAQFKLRFVSKEEIGLNAMNRINNSHR